MFGPTYKEEESSKEGFSFWVAVAFTVNYIMGTGFLTLPWAFSEAGIGLGFLVLLFMTVVSDITKDYILEALVRVRLLRESDGLDDQYRGLHPSADGEDDGHLSAFYRSPMLQTDSLNSPLLQSSAFSIGGDTGLVLGDGKVEVPEVCEVFLGLNGRRVYTFFVSVYLYGAMWAYSSVFSSALSEELKLPNLSKDESYLVYLAIFALFMIPLTCKELTEQVYIQVTLAGCRVLMVLFMVGSVLAAHSKGNEPFDDDQDDDYVHKDVVWFDFSKFYILLPIALFANIFHHSIPALAQPVRNKRSLSTLFRVTFALCFLAYTLIAISVSTYFKSSTQSSSNLNWTHYHGEHNRGTDIWWANIISYFVCCFPALDVASAFPLNGITLGNNLMSTYYGDQMKQMEKDKRTRITFRLIAAIPPLVAAAFVRSLGAITDYAGTSGICIVLLFPALLALRSERVLESRGIGMLSKSIHYSNPFTRQRNVAFFMVAMSAVCFIYIIVSLILEGSPEDD